MTAMSINETNGIITHESPAWLDRANFMIFGRLDQNSNESGFAWEQLWSKELGENLFELCCIPFFLYGFALGDIVETRPAYGKRFVISRKLQTKGHFTLRVWFQGLPHDNVLEEITVRGCSLERRFKAGRLFSIDAPTIEKRVEIESFLEKFALNGDLYWENG
jgi:hypothetical protein